MFSTDDVEGDYGGLKARGATFTIPPTDVTASTIAMVNDACGDLIRLAGLSAPLTRCVQASSRTIGWNNSTGYRTDRRQESAFRPRR